MLDDFKDNSFYGYASNLEKIYHAYIFEVDSVNESFPLILAFSKMIICKNHYKNNSKCLDCNVCHLIDNMNYQNFKIIEPDGINIKKEQILSLQKELSLKSLDGNNQVYIIKDADKMNQSASNSLLKFLEEPEKGIYGILITKDKKSLLDTIISRCILISLKSKQESYEEEDIKKISLFLKRIFKDKEESIPYIKSCFLEFYQIRDDVIKAFNIMEVIMDYLIKDKYQIKSIFKFEFYDIINTNLGDISFNKLVNVLEIIVLYKNKLITNLNLNLNLFMDRFVIEISKVL